MDYDLAKRLKDAGLPQEGLGFFAAQDRVVGSRKHSDTFDAYIPSLAELIGACGERFTSLVRQADHATQVRWLASGGNSHLISGATAVQAVARLWLALKKRSRRLAGLDSVEAIRGLVFTPASLLRP